MGTLINVIEESFSKCTLINVIEASFDVYADYC